VWFYMQGIAWLDMMVVSIATIVPSAAFAHVITLTNSFLSLTFLIYRSSGRTNLWEILDRDALCQ
jgi:hypothetical protein